MNYWYSLNLGDGMTASAPAEEIRDLFTKKFAAAGMPPEMAVFTRNESGRLHCEVIAYFSPAAAEIANAFDALPCDKPAQAELNLLAGNSAALAVLFPDTE